jgi:hypothetical protein
MNDWVMFLMVGANVGLIVALIFVLWYDGKKAVRKK